MSASLLFKPVISAVLPTNEIAPAAQLFSYMSGTTTPHPIYLDNAAETPATNPVIADASGEFPPLYLKDEITYRLVLRDAIGDVLWEVDNYTTGAGGSGTSIDDESIIVDLSDGGESNTDLVNAYVAPGGTARPYQTTVDQYNYDAAVKPEFYHDTAGSQFSRYEQGIKNFNKLFRIIKEYSANPNANKGFISVKLEAGLHEVWGEGRLEGIGGGLTLTGVTSFFTELASATFEASPRGDTWSRANIVIQAGSDPLPTGVVEGMLYMTGELLSDDTDHTASSATRIVNDDLAYLNSAHIIKEIAADRMSFKVDVPHLGTSTTRLVGGNFRTTGASKTGFPIARITIPLTQVALTGGYDGRQDEAWLRVAGSTVTYSDIGFVDHSDPLITRDNGATPDRKNFFADVLTKVILKQNVGFCGAENQVLRVAKLVVLSANLSAFGGAGLNTRAKLAGYCQIASNANFTRCSFGGASENAIECGGFSVVTAQQCVFAGGTKCVSLISGGDINIQNSWVYGSNNGFFAVYDCKIFVDSGTVFENCLLTGQLEDTCELVKIGEPKVIDCGPISEPADEPINTDADITISKTNPTLNLVQGSTQTQLGSIVGQFNITVDAASRDISFIVDGNAVPIFEFDMGTGFMKVNGVSVAGPQGAAIANPTADAASNNTAIIAILERLRAATPAIAT